MVRAVTVGGPRMAAWTRQRMAGEMVLALGVAPHARARPESVGGDARPARPIQAIVPVAAGGPRRAPSSAPRWRRGRDRPPHRRHGAL